MTTAPRDYRRGLNRAQLALDIESFQRLGMTVETAKAILRYDESGPSKWASAAGALYDACTLSIEIGIESKPSQQFLKYMLLAYDRGHPARSIASCALHWVTGLPMRKFDGSEPGRSTLEWQEYLVANGFLKPE